jgi:OPA family glycerol-3-phosphate transporter-like MFS transporter
MAADVALPAGYASRRRINWILAGTMYAFFYMARYNYIAANPELTRIFGWTNTDVGVIDGVAAFVYGVSVFLNGPLADRIGGRRALLIGAAGTIACNLLFGLGYLFVSTPAAWSAAKPPHLDVPAVYAMGLSSGTIIGYFTLVWAVNFYFQSFGALSIVKINTPWFHILERGTFSGIFGILIRGGLVLAFVGAPAIFAQLPWQFAFWIPAGCVAVMFVLNYLFVRNTPEDAGFPAFDTGDDSDDATAGPVDVRAVLAKVLKSPVMRIIALASMMTGFVRRGVVDAWWPKHFVDLFGADPKHLSEFLPYKIAAWGIAIFGITGGLILGRMSDRVFGGRRAPVIFIGFAGEAVVLLALGFMLVTGAGPFASCTCLLVLSSFVNGAHGLIGGAASMDFGGKKAAATAAGLFDGAQYIIGPLVSIGVGKLIDTVGWKAWPFAPIPFAVIGALLMIRIWNAKPGSGGHGAAPAKQG